MNIAIFTARMVAISGILGLCVGAAAIAAEGPTTRPTVALWPGVAPGEKSELGPERDTSKPGEGLVAGRTVIRLGNVSNPTITIFSPPPDKRTGAAVVVCPGGGYSILAYDLEGTEVCDWLNSIGVTGVLLKYRVPVRPGLPRYVPPLQDAQRAISMVRQRAAEWGIDPHRIGILGFSAGGHLAAMAGSSFGKRTYAEVDDADRQSCRPDFTCLIYPAYLAAGGDVTKLAPEMTVTDQTPPAIVVMAEDDPVGVENAYAYALALKKAKVACELHTYARGGHGYGLRATTRPITGWPALAEQWLKGQGLLEKK